MARVADLVERVDQGIFPVGLERYTQVDGRMGWGTTLVFPLLWDGSPCVLHSHVIPTWREGSGEAERGGGEDG
jgi:hypothetical protein